MLQMSNILGDVSEEAFMVWSFGCLNEDAPVSTIKPSINTTPEVMKTQPIE